MSHQPATLLPPDQFPYGGNDYRDFYAKDTDGNASRRRSHEQILLPGSPQIPFDGKAPDWVHEGSQGCIKQERVPRFHHSIEIALHLRMLAFRSLVQLASCTLDKGDATDAQGDHRAADKSKQACSDRGSAPANAVRVVDGEEVGKPDGNVVETGEEREVDERYGDGAQGKEDGEYTAEEA